MSNVSTLVLEAVTSIDCGVIDHTGALHGHSFNPTFIVSGSVEPTEGVVCDFGTLKKRIKYHIDSMDHGLDHKLWVPCSANVSFVDDADNWGNVILITPKIRMSAPANAFVLMRPTFLKDAFVLGQNLIHNVLTFDYAVEQAADIFTKDGNLNLLANSIVQCAVLGALMSRHLPEFTFGIGFKPSPMAFDEPARLNGSVVFPGKPALFRYTHGLPNSTSVGCQNVGHGHLSFIQCFGLQDTPFITSSAWSIAASISGTHFCNVANLGTENLQSPDNVKVEYTTPARGKFSLELTAETHLVALGVDTTVENLSSYVVNNYAQHLREHGVVCVYVSEGLNKGSLAWVPQPAAQSPVSDCVDDKHAPALEQVTLAEDAETLSGQTSD